MKSVLILFVVIAAVSAQSWDQYVNNQLVGAGLKSGAIFGFDGSVWAKNNIEPTTTETKKIVEQFGRPAAVIDSGINFGGMKYPLLNMDSGSLHGQKRSGGIIAFKTNKAVIVGTYDQRLDSLTATGIVKKLGANLMQNGY